jgi:hypothetical protein
MEYHPRLSMKSNVKTSTEDIVPNDVSLIQLLQARVSGWAVVKTGKNICGQHERKENINPYPANVEKSVSL